MTLENSSLDKETRYVSETSLRLKAHIDPDRYYKEVVDRIEKKENIPFDEIFYFLLNPVIEKIEKAPMEEKLMLSRYFLSRDHTDLEVHNMTLLPLETIRKLKENL